MRSSAMAISWRIEVGRSVIGSFRDDGLADACFPDGNDRQDNSREYYMLQLRV
jgi:hypothetical protein